VPKEDIHHYISWTEVTSITQENPEAEKKKKKKKKKKKPNSTPPFLVPHLLYICEPDNPVVDPGNTSPAYKITIMLN
jgi:hypothetical protein